MKLAFLLEICLLSSCASTTYQATKLVNVYAGTKTSHPRKGTLEDTNEFYMWGLLPKDHIVNIDQLAVRNGLSEFSVQSIEEFQSINQFLYSLLTFGMYIPKTFRIEGHGIKSDI